MEVSENINLDSFDDEGSVWEAIKTYEEILEKSPDDESALSSLSAAYETAGDAALAHEYSLRLAKLYRQSENWGELRVLAEHLLSLNPSDEVAETLRDEALQHITGDSGASAVESSVEVAGTPNSATAKKPMLQNAMITQYQYEAAIAALTESRMNAASESTLALLQELASMERVYMDKIIGFLSAQTNTPYVDVSRFEVPEDVSLLMDYKESRRLGILVFEQMGEELQVATMNPVDDGLKQRIEKHLGKKIHFYLTAPDNFQSAIEALASRANRRTQR